ncbi:HtaA domain-containing protein [Streptomyces sp. KAU_LT]|uniref:HtaA domain-containing protein n=1 Tax=Streptomyces sp. KAU_LT TaxID=3046669 RepID=UPI0024B7AFB5|nr:HtaA domain-containing protein [Streptomyces sp. KAU_LT]MDI9834429.1 HtaA domain-containing protein [Streptomyces sp. KAU_LT]
MPARLRALLVALFGVAVLGALLPATAAHAASRSVQGGRLDWGVKTSFQSYVTGPVAKGSYSLTGGAATVGGSGFRFHSATGSYDAGTGAFTASFSGGVRFTGHRTDSGAYQLDLTLSRPTVRIAGSTGTLYVDVTGKAKGTGAVTTSSQVPFASLSLRGIDMRGGGDTVVLTHLPATLTAQGARSFAGYYAAGTALDPVSLSADVRPARQQVKPSATPDARPSASAKSGSKKQSSGTALVDGAVDWGVRRTFREYVAGDIARGTWKLSAGAEDGGALFRFPDGEGTFENGDLSASFKGAIRFTGKDGLDLALSGVRVTITDGKGTLYATVRGSGADGDGEKIPLVTFAAKKPAVKDGLVRIDEAPAELTARGAKAFGGMYPAGTRMDPVSVAVALKGEARLPALPDLGSTPTASGTPTQAAATPGTRPVASAAADDGVPALPVGLAAGALLLAAAAGWLVARRRRGAAPASPDES